jgi:hypothetical protein
MNTNPEIERQDKKDFGRAQNHTNCVLVQREMDNRLFNLR